MITHRHLTEKLVSAGFREPEAKVYAAVILNGKIGATEIAGIIGTSSQNVSTIAQGLIDRHLLVKERAKYCMAEPSKFYELISNQIKDMEAQAQKSRGVLNSILETINFNYTQQSGRPIIKLLNYDQWKQEKKKLFLEGDEKILRLIRGKRYYHKEIDNIEHEDSIYEKSLEKGLKYDVLTPFVDKNLDINDDHITYTQLDSTIFKNFNLDIHIRDNITTINYRASESGPNILDVIFIENKELTESFKEMFEYMKTKKTG